MTISETSVVVSMARSDNTSATLDSDNNHHAGTRNVAFEDSRPTTPYHIIEILLNSANGQLPGVSETLFPF